MMWSGVSIAFWLGMMPPILKLQQSSSPGQKLSDIELTSKALKGMVFLGIGECLGSLGSGFVIDYIGNKNTCVLNAFMIALNGLVLTISTSSL